MLEGLTPPTATRICHASKLIQSLDKADAKILTDAIENEAGWTANALANALAGRGVSMGSDTIRKHRRKECLCFRA